jgi:hypothetical protein
MEGIFFYRTLFVDKCYDVTKHLDKVLKRLDVQLLVVVEKPIAISYGTRF